MRTPSILVALAPIARRLSRWALVAVFCAGACGGDPPEAIAPATIDVSRPECENLNPASCLAPWPSDRFLAEDMTTSTGRRLAIPTDAMLRPRRGPPVDASAYARFDGFSRNTPIATAIDGGVLDTSELAGELAIEDSVRDDSPTLLIDLESGERILHMAEIDAWAGADPTRTTLYLRPVRPLDEDRHYGVAIRALRYTDGAAVPPSPYFAALRDGLPSDVAELEERRADFEALFAALEEAGAARATLTQAWDFHTGSKERVRRELLHMRDDALARIGADGTRCTVELVEEDFGHPALFRRFSGTFEIPLYTEDEETGSPIVRDEDGLPVFQRMGVAPFTAIIPHSVAEGGAAVPIATWGHGLLGSGEQLGRVEDEEGVMMGAPFAPVFDELAMVAVATDYWGLSTADSGALAEAVADLSRFPEVPDRVMQGIINTLTLTRTMSGACSALPEWLIDGASVLDPAERRYVGVSGGAVLGSTLAALSPDIARYGLVAGGAHWPTLISRSFAFFPFNLVLNNAYPDRRERDIALTMTAHLWDVVDGASFAEMITIEPLPDSPSRRVMLANARHDDLVSNLSSAYLARAAGLPQLASSAYAAVDVPTTDGGGPSAWTVYDIGAAPLEPGTVLPPDNGVHAQVMRIPALRQQLVTFVRDGTVENYCDGVCDPD